MSTLLWIATLLAITLVAILYMLRRVQGERDALHDAWHREVEVRKEAILTAQRKAAARAEYEVAVTKLTEEARRRKARAVKVRDSAVDTVMQGGDAGAKMFQEVLRGGDGSD